MLYIVTIFCLVGIISSLITVFLNFNLIRKIVLKKSQRKDDMHLFYYRFMVDVVLGTNLLFYICFILLSTENPQGMLQYRNFIVYFGLPWSSISACRTIISLSIAIERVIAVYYPIVYRSLIRKIPNFLISTIGVAFSIFEEFAIFGICKYNFTISESCLAIGCAMNSCAFVYFSIHRSLLFSSTLFLSVLLSFKLLARGSRQGNSRYLSKTNRLALLDMLTVLCFDFFPPFCAGIWPFLKTYLFDHAGPYTAVLKIAGCAVESIVVYRLLLTDNRIMSKNVINSLPHSRKPTNCE